MKPRVTDVDVIHEGESGQEEDRISGIHPKLAQTMDEAAKPLDGRGWQGYPKGNEDTDLYGHAEDAKNEEEKWTEAELNSQPLGNERNER